MIGAACLSALFSLIFGCLTDAGRILAQPRGGDASQASGGNPAPTGLSVATAVRDRDTGRDGRLDLRMRLFDRQGRVRERSLLLLSLDGNKSRTRTTSKAATAEEGDRLLVRFTYPNDIKGTGFLVWEHPGSDDERFLYLPALGRVRRIAGAESQESFVGTDFTYEDIGGRELEDYSYTLLEEPPGWRDSEGATHPAYRLESRAKDPDATFPRVISLVRKDNFIVVQADIYNRRGERQKVYEAKKVERIEGIWTVMEAVMQDAADRTRTELTIASADYNVGLTEADFSRRELERGAR
jgi:hypothetical protein